MGKQAPKPGNYTAAAEKQAQAGTQATNTQTNANRPDQNTPFGFSNWTQGPNGQWSQNTGLNGGLGDAATGLQNQAAGMAAPMDWAQFGKLDDGSAARDQAINAAYGQATSRLNPQWAQAAQLNSSSLANSGLDPNSQAARGQNLQFAQAKNDAYGSAMNSAIAQGTAAQTATFGQNMMARQQAIAEALRKRGQPMSELAALQGFTQMPGFMGAGQGATPQYLQAMQGQDAYNLNAWNMQNQANADVWGGVMQGVGGAAGVAPLFLSDERAKVNVQRLSAEALPGVPFATWEYRPEFGGERGFGVVAQDLQRVAPEYVSEGPDDGLLYVDYSFLDRGQR